jgi:glucosamine kinase
LSKVARVRFFLGIDGGGTRTRAFLTEASGQRGGWGEAGLSNPNHATAGEAEANLEEAIAAACRKAQAERTDCVSVFVGMAGVTTEEGRRRTAEVVRQCGLNHARIGVDHDIRIALAGGLGGRPGIALIVGTGSSCYGRTSDGRTWQTGGWEALISDEGSGFWMGREAIGASARMADGRQGASSLGTQVFAWLEIDQVADLLPRIHDRGLSRSEIAAFAPRVVELAQAGDAAALNILERGAFLLAEMVAANHRRLPTGPHPDVVITGGLGTAGTLYRQKLEEALRSQLPTVQVNPPLLTPALGAALLAMEQTGLPVTPDRLETLKHFTK